MSGFIIPAIAVGLVLGADPAPATEAKKGNYLKLAAPPFSAVNMDEKVATFFSEHFAGALVQRGLMVLTASEINALIGVERSKQLIGCSEDASSCVAELSSALGVDGLVTGTVAKFGGTLQANVKIFSARDGSNLRALSIKAGGEEQLLEALTAQAALVVPDLLQRTGKELAPSAEVVTRKEPGPNQISIGIVGALGSVFLAEADWYSMEYERVLNKSIGVFVAPTIQSWNFQIPTQSNRERGPPEPEAYTFYSNSIRLEAGVRLYWPDAGPGGWFFAPQVAVGYVWNERYVLLQPDNTFSAPEEAQGPEIGAGAIVGYRWFPKENIPVTLGVGSEFRRGARGAGWNPLGRFHLGLAF